MNEPGRWYVREGRLISHMVLSHTAIAPGDGMSTICGQVPSERGWHSIAKRMPSDICSDCIRAWERVLYDNWREGKRIMATSKMMAEIRADNSTGGKPARRFAVHELYGVFFGGDTQVAVRLDKNGNAEIDLLKLAPDGVYHTIRTIAWPMDDETLGIEASQTRNSEHNPSTGA